MTNMQQVFQATDQLANKSPWFWVLFAFLGWIAVAGYVVRFISIKLNDINERLLKAENEKLELVQSHKTELVDLAASFQKQYVDLLSQLMALKAQTNTLLEGVQRELTILNAKLSKD